MITINRNPSRRELRWFGLLLALFFGLAGSLAYLRFGGRQVAVWIWAVGAVLTVGYHAVPALRRRLYVGWMYAAFPVGWLVSHLLLVIVYYGVMTPIAVTMRLLGHDAMHRRFDHAAPTYWQPHRRPPGGSSRYFRQF